MGKWRLKLTTLGPISPVQPSSSLRVWPASRASIRREICSGDHRNLSLALIYASVRAASLALQLYSLLCSLCRAF